MAPTLETMTDSELLARKEELMRSLAEIEDEIAKRHQEKSTTEVKEEKLTNFDIQRYSRQLLLPDFGVEAQTRLKNAKILIVGCGGLGCPAAQFLATCGAGTIGLVDYDVVEVSNLHRQVLHTEARIGMSKALSVKIALLSLNSSLKVNVHKKSLLSHNALPIIEQYDIILDASDNVATRYLLNDACTLAKKPLVSGSALRMEGQLTVYNYQNGPTYRCLFPSPPPPETVTNCSDGGVLGVVPGVIGTLQALEAIKIATGIGEVTSGKMLLFDAFSGSFRKIRLRERNDGEVSKVQSLIDYDQFCGSGPHDKDEDLELLEPEKDRIHPNKLKEILDTLSAESATNSTVIIDVRSPPEMKICALPRSINCPISDLMKGKCLETIADEIKNDDTDVIVVCRRGNDSQRAVMMLREKFANNEIKDVIGGLHGWTKFVDPNFPRY